ncbi:uncharacterized protein LOC110063261 [Orbicella faveolata]|uniref:uncharacterized protein LOC110063261 n=1 Tax=Orbicella faveolata TaxID=48498 RepID=UPI0009E64145|nr:uncharacterized protein LOC110063261 [Orbicella faveolata]
MLKTQEQKQKFVSAFREFSINNGCIKDFPIKSDQLHVLGFVDHVIQHLKENFVNGKVSKAKCLVQDAVVLAQNRSLIHHVGSSSYAKDPFIHKDTR